MGQLPVHPALPYRDDPRPTFSRLRGLPLAVSPGLSKSSLRAIDPRARRSLLMLHAMLSRLFVIAFAVVSASTASAQVTPSGATDAAPLAPPPVVPREFRAAWVTPIYDRGFRDWPSAPGLTPDQQRAELDALLDDAAAIGLNAVILHVRLAADALYPTKYAPWSALLSGQSGVGPSYDPLAFAVQAAHARGLQLHAWFNPFRAALPGVPGRLASTHVTRQHPEWVVRYGSQTWIDPGNPAARKYVLETILDVARRYDVDGIHLDDYFYPYRESRTYTRRVKKKRVRMSEEIPFPDARSWKRYGVTQGFADRDAWRRANIDDFVRSLYTGVKAIKPTMIVGISPFGIWRPGSPSGVTGLDSFSEIYADSRRWLSQGWVDYLAPQLYWQVDGVQDRFRALESWWRTENPMKRFVWPGLYTSHVFGGIDTWPIDEIQTQIETIRGARAGTADAPGHVHFRLSALLADNERVARSLANDYAQRALVPAFTWLGSSPPPTPSIATNATSTLSMVAADGVVPRWWLIQVRGAGGAWTTKIQPGAESDLAMDALASTNPNEVAVSAVSATGVESEPAVVAWPPATGSVPSRGKRERRQ
jgi:uncharacterized lipoprotein YddW (UPF0748 family)